MLCPHLGHFDLDLLACPLEDWTVDGSPSDCVETILRARDEIGLNRIGFTIYSLPPSPQARIEYLQMIAEDIVGKVKAKALA